MIGLSLYLYVALLGCILYGIFRFGRLWLCGRIGVPIAVLRHDGPQLLREVGSCFRWHLGLRLLSVVDAGLARRDRLLGRTLLLLKALRESIRRMELHGAFRLPIAHVKRPSFFSAIRCRSLPRTSIPFRSPRDAGTPCVPRLIQMASARTRLCPCPRAFPSARTCLRP